MGSSRAEVLAERSAELGLEVHEGPSRETLRALTDVAWIRDGSAAAEIKATKVRAPVLVAGKMAGRRVAAFTVTCAPGSVFAAKSSLRGPALQVFSRYRLFSWWHAIGWLCWAPVGAAGYWLLSSRNMEYLATGLASMAIWFFAMGVRQALALAGVWPVRLSKGMATETGDAAFDEKFSVVCSSPEQRQRLLTAPVRAAMLASLEHGAAWWSLTSGWISCVAGPEPISQFSGRVMKTSEMKALFDDVLAVAAEVEAERNSQPAEAPYAV
ncbi:MAG: hypothetical protein ACOYN0_08385 [Phycisphaerales bacterium]